MKNRFLLSFSMMFLITLFVVSNSIASTIGAISTDRFGYAGTVVRYGSLSDAQNQINGVSTNITERDLSLSIVNDLADFDTDENIIMGSWWYSTEGSAGWGNTNGNSGTGFLQLYDEDSSTDTSLSMEFTNFTGTYWDEFSLSINGSNATNTNDYARFWVDFQGWGADSVNFHSYQLNLVASGSMSLT